MTYTNQITPSKPEVFSNNDGQGRSISWFSDNESNEGFYEVVFRGEAGCKIEEVVFTINIRSKCNTMELRIEEFGETVFDDK